MLIQLQLETCYQFHSHLIKQFAEVSSILALESRLLLLLLCYPLI